MSGCVKLPGVVNKVRANSCRGDAEDMLSSITYLFRWTIPIIRPPGASFFQQTHFYTAYEAFAYEWTINFIGSPQWPEMKTVWRLFLDHCKIFTQPTPLAIVFKLQLMKGEECSPQIASAPDAYHSTFFSSGNYRLFEGNPLLASLTEAFDVNSRWQGGRALLTVEMRFAASDFQIRMNKVLPVQSLLRDGDFRRNLKDIYRNIEPDFIFKTLDGEVHSYKSLLYISSPYFRDLLSSDNIALNQITLNYNREAVLQTLSYMIFGVFESPEIVNPELIPQMLKCAKHFQLRMTQFDDDIGRVLVFQLLNNLDNLDEIIKILSLTHRQQAYYQVKRMCIAMIVEKHYRRFIQEYNSDAVGEKLDIFERLSSAIVPSLSPVNRIHSIYRGEAGIEETRAVPGLADADYGYQGQQQSKISNL
uniref:BTB domain-containing protein n=1 Tax=Setaria digitata TaxID=48799 RepID=A0A915PS09_9BILA